MIANKKFDVDLKYGQKRENRIKKMIEEGIEALDIYWFVTVDDKQKDIPQYVEGLIMQRYFETFGELPLWNEVY